MRRYTPGIACLIVLLTLAIPAAMAADIMVEGACSLAEAITAANNDAAVGACPAGAGHDSIQLSEDILIAAMLPAIQSHISIDGGEHRLDGAGESNFFLVEAEASLTLVSLIVENGRSVDGLSPIELMPGASLSIIDSAFIGNASAGDGGVIHSRQGMLEIMDSRFEGNAADGNGGVISMQSAADADDDEDEHEDDEDEGDNAGSVVISGVSFKDNQALSGGAIYLSGGQLTISDSAFSDNRASEHGGAVYSSGGSVDINATSFSGNQAALYGGAIDNIAESQMRLSQSQFEGNTATTGGAIGNWRSGLLVINSGFEGNSAENGGAIQNEEGQQSICHSQFSANRASNFGSAIYNVRGKLSALDSVFSGHAAGQGGLIHIIEPDVAEANLSGLSFIDNAGPDCVGCDEAGEDASDCPPNDAD